VPQPFWGASASRVKPYAIHRGDEMLLPGPPLPNTIRNADFIAQFTQVAQFSGSNGDFEKITAEFWASGSGAIIWQGLAADTAQNLNFGIKTTAKLIFAQAAAAYDSGIAAFIVKRQFDSGRPISVIPCLFNGQNITIWAGPWKGAASMDGNNFQSYLVTPPFPEYISAHSAFSAASATVMTAFLEDSTFRANYPTVLAGQSRTEPKITNTSDPRFVNGLTNVPNTGPGTKGYTPATDITLTWPTWDSAAQSAGISRLYGGFHIQSSNEDGQSLGRSVARIVWNKLLTQFGHHKGHEWQAPVS